VFESAYGTIAGVPVAAGGAIWSALVLLLSAWGMRKPASEEARRAAGYVFLLSTVGLAVVFYLTYASFFVLHQLCVVCLTIDVSVIGIFLISANAAGPLRALQTGFAKDLRPQVWYWHFRESRWQAPRRRLPQPPFQSRRWRPSS
jgi:hypothetical protein